MICKEQEVRIRFEHKYEALQKACVAGSLEDVQALIANAGEDRHVLLSAKDDFGSALLRDAAHRGQLELVKLLVEAGAEIDQTCFGMTSLYAAATMGKLDVVQYLVDQGADMNIQDREMGRTPLMNAMIGGRNDVALWLIEQGAICDDAHKDHDGKAAIDWAAIFCKSEVFFALADRGVLDDRGMLPLELVVRHHRPQLLEDCLVHPVYRAPMLDERFEQVIAACPFPSQRQHLLAWRTGALIEHAIGAPQEGDHTPVVPRKNKEMSL